MENRRQITTTEFFAIIGELTVRTMVLEEEIVARRAEIQALKAEARAKGRPKAKRKSTPKRKR